MQMSLESPTIRYVPKKKNKKRLHEGFGEEDIVFIF